MPKSVKAALSESKELHLLSNDSCGALSARNVNYFLVPKALNLHDWAHFLYWRFLVALMRD